MISSNTHPELRPTDRFEGPLNSIATMACWSDLPNELRLEILRYLFFNTTTSRHASAFGQPKQMPQFLSLVLVSKSFVDYKDVVQAMMSETMLHLHAYCDTFKIDSNPKYGTMPLNRLRSLQIGRPFQFIRETNLQKFKSKLPSLTRVHVQLGAASSLPLWRPPLMFIPAGSKLDTLLRAEITDEKPDYAGQLRVRSIPSSDGLNPAIQRIDMLKENHDDSADKFSSGLAVSEALTFHNGFDNDYTPTRWLARLLTDAVDRDIGIEVTLSWELAIRVIGTAPGRKDNGFKIYVSKL